MTKRDDVKSVLVEFNRFGEVGDTLQKGKQYIRTTGDERPACQITVGLGYREFGQARYRLRYVKWWTVKNEFKTDLGAAAAALAALLPDEEIP